MQAPEIPPDNISEVLDGLFSERIAWSKVFD